MSRLELALKSYRVPLLAWQCGEWSAPIHLFLAIWKNGNWIKPGIRTLG